LGDPFLLRRQGRVAEVVVTSAHRHRRDFGDALSECADGEALRAEPLSVARVARLLAHELSILVACGFRARLLELAHQARNHALVANAPSAVVPGSFLAPGNRDLAPA